jgi:PAS domain S-box-containing protein
MDPETAQRQFFESLGRPFSGDGIFDHVPDTVFFIKDREGRYVTVNQTLVERCGGQRKEELIGKIARAVFPPPLGESFTEQDFDVLKNGRSIHGQLELHLYPGGGKGWCLTWKEPVIAADGSIAGVSGISRDIGSGIEAPRDLEAISTVLNYLRENLESDLKVTDLAKRAGLSTYQLDQRIRALFGISAGQYITRCRIEFACHQLERTDEPIGFIALDSGYGDQSAFTRQFRQSVGLPPGAYRERMRTS